MSRTARKRIPPLLILAYLAALVAPLRTSWACADGTHCVQDHSRQFVCPGGACSTGASCCRLKKAVACKHGAFPSIGSAPASAEVDAPDHCRFSLSAAPKLVANVSGVIALVAHTAALPVVHGPELPLPVVAPTWLTEYSLGYRPPPLRACGPSRAPPIL